MKWEETVLTQSEFEEAEKEGEWENDYNPILMRQAEISFKAGYEHGFQDAKNIATDQAYEAGLETGRERGIREVVEWIETNIFTGEKTLCLEDFNEWRAKLKEWGI